MAGSDGGRAEKLEAFSRAEAAGVGKVRRSIRREGAATGGNLTPDICFILKDCFEMRFAEQIETASQTGPLGKVTTLWAASACGSCQIVCKGARQKRAASAMRLIDDHSPVAETTRSASLISA